MAEQTVQNKPTAAVVLSILAGVSGLILSLVSLVSLLSVYSSPESYGYSPGEDLTTLIVTFVAIFIWTLIASVLVIVGGQKVHSHPVGHTKWGVVILIFSIAGLGTFPLAFGGWILWAGLVIAILGVVGGILALAFKPLYAPRQQPYAPPQYQQPYPQQPYPTQQQAPYQQPYAQPPPPQPAYAPQQPPPQSAYPPQQIKRFCPNCGRVIDENVKFCPNCGKQLA